MYFTYTIRIWQEDFANWLALARSFSFSFHSRASLLYLKNSMLLVLGKCSDVTVDFQRKLAN